MLFEADVRILLFLCLISGFQKLLGGFGLVGGGVIVHSTHIVNTVRPLCREVYDEETPLQPSFVF